MVRGFRWLVSAGALLASLGVVLLGVGLLGGQAAEAQSARVTIRLRADLEVRNREAPQQPIGPLPLVQERVRTEIDGQHAITTLRQVFRNQSGARLEGRYVLRPSMDARVDGFAYYIGEERVEGEVLERRTARAVYEEVTRPTVQRDPALLEQTGDGEFTFRVFPIEPGEDKRLEIRTAEWLSRRGSSVTYRFPVRSPSASVEVLLRDPRAREVRSPSHAIQVESIEGGLRVRASQSRGPNPEELILRWELQDEPWQPAIFVHRDEGHAGYFLVSLAAPDGFEDRVSAKDVTLVLDHSGSMAGDAIVHAREAASDIIRRLGPEDRLNVIAFDDDVDPLFHRPRVADRSARAEALRFVASLRPGGGTDIAFALQRSLDSQHGGAGRPRVVIFLTDGQSDAAPAIEVATRHDLDARVFTVGVGGGVNRALLSRLSAVKRGSFTYIDRASQIEPEVGHLYAQIARPLLVDVSIDVDGASAYQTYPRTVSDLFVDDELLVVGRFRGARGPIRVRVSGQLGDRRVSFHNTAVAGPSRRRPWVGRRWAIGRVDHLLEDISLGQSDAERQQEVVSLALAYHFVTPYTSFLAIPEREVTAAAAQTLANGRAQRAQAQSRHGDAFALTAGGHAVGLDRTEMQMRLQAAPSAPEPEPTMAADYESYDEAEADFSQPRAPMDSDRAGGSYPHASAAGCGSCAVSEREPAPIGILFIGLVLAVWARRRILSDK